MMEGAIMEYAKWFISIIALSFIMSAVVFMFKINELNSFQQEVNYQIERHGGLTDAAMVDLNKHVIKVYGGCLDTYSSAVTCKKGNSSGFFVNEYKKDGKGGLVYNLRKNNEQARYGTEIKYVISREIGGFTDVDVMKPIVTGASASRVRGTVAE